MAPNFRLQYRQALRDFLERGGEEARQRAYELGRQALEQRLGIVELLSMHQELLHEIGPGNGSGALDFLAEAAAPLEMELRGYHEANLALQEMNRLLEIRVEQRTRSLKKAEQDLRIRASRQEALADMSRQALGELDLEALFKQAVLFLSRSLDTEFTSLMQLQPGRESLVMVSGLGWDPALIGSHKFGIDPGSLSAYVLGHEEPTVYDDLLSEERFKPSPLLTDNLVVAGISVPVQGAEGPWGMIGAHTRRHRAFDLDDARFMQSLANVLSAALRRKGAEEALALSEERLHQSQKLEAIGRLAGGVAHDFNNLLTVINGYTELALEQAGQGRPLQSELEEIKNAGARAANLTRQLLAFGRKQMIAPRLLDLNTVVTGMESMLRRLISEDITLRLFPGKDLGMVRADTAQLEQVLMNLVVNARDAMREGGSLTVETANVSLDKAYLRAQPDLEPGPYVMLAVSDTGQGMDQQTQERLFEPFFTTKEKGQGTGLGLATVYGIVKQNRGLIWVYSELGKGSTFKVYLPRARGEEEAEAPPVQAPAASPLKGSETVLVVEDDEMVRRLTCGILQAAGYRVLEAAGGPAALELLKELKNPPQLMITDVVMPEINGRQLARKVEEIFPDIRVLYLSGYASSAVVAQGILEPGLDFLQKPYTPSELSAKVRELLDRPRGQIAQ